MQTKIGKESQHLSSFVSSRERHVLLLQGPLHQHCYDTVGHRGQVHDDAADAAVDEDDGYL